MDIDRRGYDCNAPMNTDARELSEQELYDNQGLDREYGMKIISHSNGSFNGLKNAVFLAFVLGMGAIVWQQQNTNAGFREEIAVLKIECRNNAVVPRD